MQLYQRGVHGECSLSHGMVCSYLASAVLFAAVAVNGQQNGDIADNFICPENNGKFPDPEQCDLFYICRNGVATIEYCTTSGHRLLHHLCWLQFGKDNRVSESQLVSTLKFKILPKRSPVERKTCVWCTYLHRP